ncbi:MAG: anthranilate phosphoribosyltransferase [Balneolaceae bacterium]
MNIKEILEKLSFANDLTSAEAEDSMNSIMSGEFNTEQVAGFLTAMRLKGETSEELTAFVKVMREKAVSVNVNIEGAVDLVGTGGDKSGTFNISTISAVVTAGAGVPIIKHGNRSASSLCGSADVLAQLGAKIELGAPEVEKVFNDVGIAFMFAPMFHPAMKYVMPARRALGFRTFFNVLGPLCNPAGVKRYVVGAFNKETAEKMAHILANLDTEFGYTFNSHDGLDEVSTTSNAEIFEIKDSVISESISFTPESIGFQRVEMDTLLGGTPDVNADIFNNILDNKSTLPQKEIALLNATFAIQASGKVETLLEAKELAIASLESGNARKIFDHFVEATNSVGA